MQAVILAAGEGKRLLPLTLELPKCLVPIAGKPILKHQLEALQKAGVKRVVVVTGAHREKVESFLKNAATELGMELLFTHNEAFKTTNVLASFSCALPQIKKDDTLFVVAGDVFFKPQVMTQLAKKEGELLICASLRQCGEEEVKVMIQNGRVTKLGKKLDPVTTQGEFLGVFKAGPAAMPIVLSATIELLKNDAQHAYLFNMLNRVAEQKQVGVLEVDASLWEDIDCAEDIERISAKIGAKA